MSSYLTTKTMPIDEQDHEDMKTLADARVSLTHSARFRDDRISYFLPMQLAIVGNCLIMFYSCQYYGAK
jgi:hypothetical protein